MVQVIGAGNYYTEDFNYGYPYGSSGNFRTLPPQLKYSDQTITVRGELRSTSSIRSQYSIQYLDKSQEPSNLDLGAHTGGHNSAPFYLMWPKMGWGQVQIVTLTITLNAPGNLAYDRSFDGHTGDRFVLIVNGHERTTYTHSAGHNWTTDVTVLRAGTNNVCWVVMTAKYTPPVTRNGTTVSNPVVPVLNRYFRLTRLSVENVPNFPGGTIGSRGPTAYADLGSDGNTDVGSTTFNAHVGYRGTAYLHGYATPLYKGKNGSAFLSGGATVYFAGGSSTNGVVYIDGDSSFYSDGRMSHAVAAFDHTMELASAGALTVEMPFDTVQTAYDLIRPLQQVTFTMQTPTFVNGLPVIPSYRDTQTTNVTTAGGYLYTDPVSPSSVSHVLPITPTYRWISTDITGADDSQVTSWTEHTSGSNPKWTSNSIYGPTVHPHEHFNDLDASYTTYSRTLHFYQNSGEHMWLDMPATAFPTTVTNSTPFQNYTWMFVAMMHPLTGLGANYGITLLDSRANGNIPADYTTNIQQDDDITVNDGISPYRSLIRFQHTRDGNQAVVSLNNSTKLVKPWVLNYKPCVYFGIFQGAGTILEAYGDKYYQRVQGDAGAGSNYNVGFMLGRTNGFMNRYNFSTMTIFETAFFNRSLQIPERKAIAYYLLGVYQTQKYR